MRSTTSGASAMTGGSPVTGTGDEVFIYTGAPVVAVITHDGESNLAVCSCPLGRLVRDPLINEIGPYSGTCASRPVRGHWFLPGPALVTVTVTVDPKQVRHPAKGRGATAR